MTTSTQGFIAPGLAASGAAGQLAGTGPGFPAPIGAEQMFGYPQQAFGFAQQIPGYAQQHQLGFQQYQPGVQQYQAQLAAQQLADHILRLAQQVILPQVAIIAAQQVQQQLPQVVAHLTMSQQAQSGQPQWGQPQWGLPFGSLARAYPVLS